MHVLGSVDGQKVVLFALDTHVAEENGWLACCKK